MTRRGQQVVVADCTAGELGSRGSATLRQAEADAAAKVLGLHRRVNLGLADGALGNDIGAARLALVRILRQWQPRLVLSMAGVARHPDHLALSTLLPGAMKAAALFKWPDADDLPTWRGDRLLCYEAEVALDHSAILIAASEADWQCKRSALRCYRSQFGLDHGAGAATAISDPAFLQWIEQRGRTWGYQAGAVYAEAFTSPLPTVVSDPMCFAADGPATS